LLPYRNWVERDIYGRHNKCELIKNLGEDVMVHYTGGSVLVAGARMEGMLFERMDARAIPAATGGAGVVGDE